MATARERERTLGFIRKICLALPETSERPSHGAPTFFVRKKTFVMQALNVIADYVVYALLPATGTMMLGAAGWLLGRDRALGWLGWAALVLGVGLFVPFIGVLAFILSLLWIIVASITLFRTRAAEPALAPA